MFDVSYAFANAGFQQQPAIQKDAKRKIQISSTSSNFVPEAVKASSRRKQLTERLSKMDFVSSAAACSKIFEKVVFFFFFFF
jgi:hypothetical protein